MAAGLAAVAVAFLLLGESCTPRPAGSIDGVPAPTDAELRAFREQLRQRTREAGLEDPGPLKPWPATTQATATPD
jgi:hypothetical protein